MPVFKNQLFIHGLNLTYVHHLAAVVREKTVYVKNLICLGKA